MHYLIKFKHIHSFYLLCKHIIVVSNDSKQSASNITYERGFEFLQHSMTSSFK